MSRSLERPPKQPIRIPRDVQLGVIPIPIRDEFVDIRFRQVGIIQIFEGHDGGTKSGSGLVEGGVSGKFPRSGLYSHMVCLCLTKHAMSRSTRLRYGCNLKEPKLK